MILKKNDKEISKCGEIDKLDFFRFEGGDFVLKYEKLHLDSENRRSGKYLEVLHPEYEEFGKSGKRYRKEDFMKNGKTTLIDKKF